MAAYRYEDSYAVHEGRWCFSSRSLSFMYVVPFEAMATSFGDRRRIRWPEQAWADAELPESLPSWDR